MADNKVDDTAVAEPQTEEPETPSVEFDKEIEVVGDVVENPVIEEEEEASEEPVEPAEEPGEPAEEPTEPEQPAETEEAPEAPAEEPVEEIVPEKDETGVYDPTVPDPGEFQPKQDYSFEVTTTDGKTVKISSQEEADKFAERLDNEEGLVSASQFAKFTRLTARMDVGVERERADYQAEREKFELQQAQEKVRNEQIIQWNNELNYLQAKGLLPEIPADKNADWLKNREDPAVKARMDIFEWMDKENQARRSAGIGEVTSAVDAYQLMKAEQSVDEQKTERKRETTERQARGKMVSSSSPYIESNTPNNSIIGEGGNLNDLILEAQMNL